MWRGGPGVKEVGRRVGDGPGGGRGKEGSMYTSEKRGSTSS